jgi:hypothetical protein
MVKNSNRAAQGEWVSPGLRLFVQWEIVFLLDFLGGNGMDDLRKLILARMKKRATASAEKNSFLKIVFRPLVLLINLVTKISKN